MDEPLDAVFASEGYRSTLDWLNACTSRHVLYIPIGSRLESLLAILGTDFKTVTSTRGVVDNAVTITSSELREYALGVLESGISAQAKEVIAAVIVASSSICKNFLIAFDEAVSANRPMTAPTITDLLMMSRFAHIGVPASLEYMRACIGLAADTATSIMMLTAFASKGNATYFASALLDSATKLDIIPLCPAMMEDYAVYSTATADDIAQMVASNIAPDLALELLDSRKS